MMYLTAVLPSTLWMQTAGLVLILAAMVLHVWTRAHLRDLYSGHLEVQVGHRLIQSGPYLLVQHPEDTGFIILPLGLCIGYSCMIGLDAILGLLLPELACRIKVEERLLIEQFGEEYRAYAHKTKQLIPGIW